jgi:hypothetical protein
MKCQYTMSVVSVYYVLEREKRKTEGEVVMVPGGTSRCEAQCQLC